MMVIASLTNVAYSQEVSSYEADKDDLNIEDLELITTLDIIEVVDNRMMPDGTADTVNTEMAGYSSSGVPTKKKVRLKPEQVKLIIPEAVYEYPNGRLEIDYESLIAIIFLAHAEDKKRIKELEKEIEKIKKEKLN